MSGENIHFNLKTIEIDINENDQNGGSIIKRKKMIKIEVNTYTFINSKKSDVTCISARESRFSELRNSLSSSNNNNNNNSKYKELAYLAVIRNVHVTVGFKKSDFMQCFKNTPYKKTISNLVSESSISQYAKIDPKAILPKFNYANEINTNYNATNSNNNNNNNNETTKKAPKNDYIIPVVFLPYILNGMPDIFKQMNSIHDICTDMMLSLFRCYINTNRVIFKDYSEQLRYNWTRLIKANESKLETVNELKQQTIANAEIINTLLRDHVSLLQEVKNLKRKIDDIENTE